MRSTMLLLGLAISQLALAVGNGSLMGQITDPETNEPVNSATITLDCKGSQIVFSTNEKGYYYASNIPPCVYTMNVSFMEKSITLQNVQVVSDETKELNASLGTVKSIGEVVVDGGVATKKLIDPYNIDVIKISHIDLEQQPITQITQALETLPAEVNVDGKTYVHGSRADGLAYYIDGCKITGNPNVPICGVQMMQVYTGYIPAKYGDSTAGIVAIETRNFFSE